MKTTLMPALVAVCLIGLWTSVPAVAQYGAYAPAGVQPAALVSQDGATPQATPRKQSTATGAATVSGGPTAVPSGTPNAAPDDQCPVDNGLWEGASVGPGCSKCGGGSSTPADWYTMQGARIMSRSNTRKVFISEQAPLGGTYAAQPDPNNAANYHVFNNLVTLFNDASGTLRQSLTAPNELFNSKQLAMGTAGDYNMTLGHYFCRDRNNNDHFVELTFWGLNSWTFSKTLAGYAVPIYDENQVYTQPQAIQINLAELVPFDTGFSQGSLKTPYPNLRELTPGATPDQKTLSKAFNNDLEHDLSYRSTINNFELNGRFSPRGEPDRLVLHPDGKWRNECQPGTYMSYLYGLRFMQIDETFNFHAISHGLDTENQVIYDAAGDYDVVTHNSLVGLQIGADMTFRRCRWAWGITSKIGPYVNFANQASTVDGVVAGQPSSAVTQQFSSNNYSAALIGEVGFQGTYKFRPNLVGRASYDFMWITGVALAPEQVQFVASPVNFTNSNGSIFSQGVSLGLEYLW